MEMLGWLVAIAAGAGAAYSLWRLRERWRKRSQEAEARLASFVAAAYVPSAAPAPATAPAPRTAPAKPPRTGADPEVLAQQKLLLDAAAKAGEAGEPVLSIQLYARLLSRYPESAHASAARAAVEMQKKRIAKR